MSLALGHDAPSFELAGTDGGQHTLESYESAEALVLVQSCNHCPYVQAWEGRMKAIQADYADRGVRIVAVNSNDADRYPEDSFEEMQRRAAREGFNFDYLWDADQSVVRALGAERTPEVFVFDRARRLVYHGAIDDSRDERAVGTHYLRDALDAVLDGRAPAIAETPPSGCTVKWPAPSARRRAGRARVPGRRGSRRPRSRSSTTPGTGRRPTTASGSTGRRTATSRRTTSPRATTRPAACTRRATRPSSRRRWPRSERPGSTRSSSRGGAAAPPRTRGCRSCSPRRGRTGSPSPRTSSRTRSGRSRASSRTSATSAGSGSARSSSTGRSTSRATSGPPRTRA